LYSDLCRREHVETKEWREAGGLAVQHLVLLLVLEGKDLRHSPDALGPPLPGREISITVVIYELLFFYVNEHNTRLNEGAPTIARHTAYYTTSR
jgi:hypothetical protein